MQAKKFLKGAASLLVIAALSASGCATPSTSSTTSTAAPAASTQAAPTVAEAQTFVDNAERELAALNERAARMSWVYNTDITYDTEWLNQRSDAEVTETLVRLASGAARFQHLDLPPDVARKINLLRLSLTLPAPQSPGAADELSALTTRMQSNYSTSKIDYQGHQVPLDDLEGMMGTERNPARLQEIWTKWHDTATPIRDDYAHMVEIANQGARDLGFADVGQMWLSNYDMPPDQMAAEVERLWSQLRPLYTQLHCYVRMRLNQRYGDAIVPLDQPIRADLLGNMWAQSWQTLYPMVAPPHSGPSYDLTTLLNQQHYDPVRMLRTGERFYTSLGLEALPQTFWERSQITRPRDRDVVCHASAWDLDDKDDIRVKMCIHIDAENFQTVHHELGHNYYQRAYQHQPTLFRNGANDGFHEAIGDFIALNTTPEYLAQIGVIRRNQIPPPSADTGLLLNMALDKIAFLPFAYSVDHWRWDVFAGRVTPAQYNDAWWATRLRYQGVRPPVSRPSTAFDPGAKYHIAANVPYLRYFLSYVLQFQFYKAACEQAHWTGPLHRCTIYGNREVGANFNRMLEMGASHPWPDALEAFTGSRQLDASAMAAYFQPLNAWLEQQNRGQRCGWQGEDS
ncbi:MAG TPA: M2 family metallopeptidase [Caulobacterales bacterium]|nr:M2 family metallopeptidase [Caulobacterales bacterium]